MGAAKMRLPYLVAAVICDILLLSAPTVTAADSDSNSDSTDSSGASALWVQPSSGPWYGIDGLWSSFAVGLGNPGQIVYLSVATALSEIWAVENHGCAPSAAQLCVNARGGIFDISGSKTWRPLGPWQLGMNYTGNTGVDANGDYGLDTITLGNTLTRESTTTNGAVVAAINDTTYYQGFIGVGVTQGKFGTNLTLPFISQLAEISGTIPSHSYGYTAGAYYRNTDSGNGTVASLTLGGFDKLRFVPHKATFSLDPSIQRLPVVLLRGVSAQVTSLDKAPSNWTSTSQDLVTMNDTIKAVIDTSTPYLWLPTEVCERFAAALNLTWREDLGVYVFSDGAQYTRFLSDPSLSFTFSLSSYDNSDNFGQPLNVPGVVNITLPSAAFALTLRYPFKSMKFGDPGIAYFPLKRSPKHWRDNQYVIGRAFMQEAYMITRYDSGTFSLHQALFPDNASRNYSLVSIERPPDSPYPQFVKPPSNDSHGLSTSQTVGIVLSAFAIGSVLGAILWWCCRRRRKGKKSAEPIQENKDDTQSDDDGLPRSPVKRMFTIIIGRKRSKKPLPQEVHGNSSQPVEVGADAQHQLFELPVPPEPVELDSSDIRDEDADLSGESSQGLSEYEIARRKLERQLLGPVPVYSPQGDQEKSMQDMSPVAHHRPTEDPSPISSPTYANSNSLPDSLPSPLSPHPEWATRMFDFPSPMTVAPPAHLPLQAASDGSNSSYSPVSPHSPQTFAPSSVSRSESDNVSPTSPIGSLRLPPTPTYQRTPIDPSRVICLGPLPEDIQLPTHQPSLAPTPQRSAPPIPQIVTPDGRTVDTGRSSLRTRNGGGALRQSRTSRGSSDSLGSNFTVEEEHRLREEEMTRQPNSGESPVNDLPRSPRSMERIETGCELVHVPQVAEKRYSWEEK